MTHLDQITKQATDALNTYAANAGVPADKIPALTITQTGDCYQIKTPGLRVAAAIADAIDIAGMTAARTTNFGVCVSPTPTIRPTESLEQYMLRNGFERGDI